MLIDSTITKYLLCAMKTLLFRPPTLQRKKFFLLCCLTPSSTAACWSSCPKQKSGEETLWIAFPPLLLSPAPYITSPKRLSLVAQMVKNLPVMSETRLDPCRREWLPIPVFSPREFHRQRNLAGYSPWSHSVGHDRVKNVFFHFSRGSQKYSVNLLTS